MCWVGCVAADDMTWSFQTVYGQSLKIDYIPENKTYTLHVADISETVYSCANDFYSICFLSDFIEVAIPREKIKQGDTWGIRKTKFSVDHPSADLKILGKRINDVHYIKVLKDIEINGVEKKRHFRILYSNTKGLFAFTEVTDGSNVLPLFIGSDDILLGGKWVW